MDYGHHDPLHGHRVYRFQAVERALQPLCDDDGKPGDDDGNPYMTGLYLSVEEGLSHAFEPCLRLERNVCMPGIYAKVAVIDKGRTCRNLAVSRSHDATTGIRKARAGRTAAATTVQCMVPETRSGDQVREVGEEWEIMQSPGTGQQDIISDLGIHRVIEPQGSLPQPAWKLDNTPVARARDRKSVV